MMSQNSAPIIERRLRSPRAAAIAGMIFSVLLTITIVIYRNITAITPDVIDRVGLETGASAASLAVTLVPFAGLFFLWFTGVIRDWAGEREDKFFATLFMGSGILIVGLLFVWAAIFGSIFSTYAMLADSLTNDAVLVFGSMIMNEILGTYIIMMMGMYMLSTALLWSRTASMPRWLTVITIVLALVFIFLAGRITGGRLLFPAWVFFISVYILVVNFRSSRKQEDAKDRFLGQ
jgi:MFS family permease